MDMCHQASDKYLKSLCPSNGCSWRFVENLAFAQENIKLSQSLCFQIRWKVIAGAHDLDLDVGLRDVLGAFYDFFIPTLTAQLMILQPERLCCVVRVLLLDCIRFDS